MQTQPLNKGCKTLLAGKAKQAMCPRLMVNVTIDSAYEMQQCRQDHVTTHLASEAKQVVCSRLMMSATVDSAYGMQQC